MEDVTLTIDATPYFEVTKQFLKVSNQEVNRGFMRVGSEFMREFTSNRLRAGVFNISRGGIASRNPRGHPPIPAKARKAGFKARLGGAQKLRNKYMRISSSSPLIVMREYKIPPKPSKDGWMYVRVKPSEARGFKGKGARARKAQWGSRIARAEERLGSRFYKRFGTRVIVAKVKQIKQPPALGFVNAWNGFAGQRRSILQWTASEIVRRVQLKLDRAARRRAG